MFFFDCSDPEVWSAFLAAWGIESEIEIPPPPKELLDELDPTDPEYEFHLADYAEEYIAAHLEPVSSFFRNVYLYILYVGAPETALN